jgi:hypothetical protein
MIPENNIILEEESNFNLNTFSMNLRNNNLDLNYHNDDTQIDTTLITEEIEKYLTNAKHCHSVIDISVIVDNMKPDNLNEEIASIVFYKLLIVSQSSQLYIKQDKPFTDIYI